MSVYMALRLSSAQAKAWLGKTAAPAKWRNTKTTLGADVFDSAWEARHYGQLQLREKIGEVRALYRQVPFRLVVNGSHICTYKADFVYQERRGDGTWWPVVEDCKSAATRVEPVYRLKHKLMRAVYGIAIREVLNGPTRRKR